MLRCEILDIVDTITKCIRNNNLPFGGMKLLFLGDLYQMEPVSKKEDKDILEILYPKANRNYYFFNANTMRNNDFFEKRFDIFQIDEDYRHKDDTVFCNMLKDLRVGKKSLKAIKKINKQYKRNGFIDEDYQYLTTRKSTAQKYNAVFLDRLKGCQYKSVAKKYLISNARENIDCPFIDELILKENMKIMFVKNDNKRNGNRWVNGTMGKIIKINIDDKNNEASNISVMTDDGNIVEVEREKMLLCSVLDEEKENVPYIEQFPIMSSWAITIDKSQGLTLDKVAIVIEKTLRPNQLYVALSRARMLSDIVLLERKIMPRDIIVSKNIEIFFENYGSRIINIKNENQIEI
jgi:ATP-dependent exoDNAse (exonuclease V) alpha subunit